MPRGVKGSGTPKAKKVIKTEATEKKARKAYPSREERIAMADKQIERLTKLNAARTALIEKTAKTLAERQDALEKSAKELEKAIAKKERLLVIQQAPEKAQKVKLTPEERKARIAAGRAAKKAEREKVAAIVAALEENGHSIDEILANLNA